MATGGRERGRRGREGRSHRIPLVPLVPRHPGQCQQAGARRVLVCALRSHAKAGLGSPSGPPTSFPMTTTRQGAARPYSVLRACRCFWHHDERDGILLTNVSFWTGGFDGRRCAKVGAFSVSAYEVQWRGRWAVGGGAPVDVFPDTLACPLPPGCLAQRPSSSCCFGIMYQRASPGIRRYDGI